MKVIEAVQGNCGCILTELQKCLRPDMSTGCRDQFTHTVVSLLKSLNLKIFKNVKGQLW